MKIRFACAADAEALIRLNSDFNEVDNITPEDVRRSLAHSAEVVVVAETGSAVVPFAVPRCTILSATARLLPR